MRSPLNLLAGRKAQRYSDRAYALMSRGRYQQAIALCDQVLEWLRDQPLVEVRPILARCLLTKGVAQISICQPREAIRLCDEVISRLDLPTDLQGRSIVALAMRYKIGAMTDLGDNQSAIRLCEEVISQFGDAGDEALRYSVAVTSSRLASLHALAGSFPLAMTSYEQLIEKFSRDSQADIRALVATVRYDRGVTLERLGRHQEAIAECEVVVRDFGTLPEAEEVVAQARFSEGVQWLRLGNPERAISAYRTVVDTYMDSSKPTMRALVAKALFSEGTADAESGRFEEAITAYNRVIDGYRDDVLPARDVSDAFTNKAVSLFRLGRKVEAIAVCGEVRQRLVGATDDHSLNCLETVGRIEEAPDDYEFA